MRQFLLFLSIYFTCIITSALLPLISAKSGTATIQRTLAAAICKSMKLFVDTGVTQMPLKNPTVCQNLQWTQCKNCPKFKNVPCAGKGGPTNAAGSRLKPRKIEIPKGNSLLHPGNGTGIIRDGTLSFKKIGWQKLNSFKVSRKSSRIVSGRQAKKGEFPYIVRLVTGTDASKQRCGATIINENWILTSASCVEGLPTSQFTAVAGDHISCVDDSDKQKRSVQKMIVHPDFDYTTLLGDITLLKLDAPFSFNDLVKAIPMYPDYLGDGSQGESFKIAGWGWTNGDSPSYSGILQESDQKLGNIDNCVEEYEGWEWLVQQDEHICTKAVGNNGGYCFGDHGGPIIMSTADGDRLVGVMHNRRTCSEDYSLVSTRISRYVQWINDNAV